MGGLAQTLGRPRAVGAEKAALLWISDSPMPANVRQAVAGRYEVRELALTDSLAEHAKDAHLALVYPAEPAQDIRRVCALVEELERTSLVGLLLLNERDWSVQRLFGCTGRFAVAAAEGAPQVLAGQISTVAQLRPALEGLHREVTRARAISSGMGKTLDQVDEEMRLAARLQRDFLPRTLPQVGPVRFSVLYRPATWVSGDIYSVERLDEHTIGFYVADAVGHGLPAALLTMFIKRALPTKRILGQVYQIVPPDQAMHELNQAICEQDLSSCQFCTALYCVVDTRTLEMVFARGGHPPPVLLRADGRTEEPNVSGGLLGLQANEPFGLSRVQLSPGDRLVLHTDGAEDVFRHGASTGRAEFIAVLEKLRGLPADQMTFQLAGVIDSLQGSLHPEDDITLLVMDVAV
jgi:phosphoserine phosphatase RsbU/P